MIQILSFLAFNATWSPMLLQMNENKLRRMVNTTEFVCVLIADKKEKNILSSFLNASIVYPYAEFVVVQPESATHLLEGSKFSPPVFQLYTNGTLSISVPLPTTELCFGMMLEYLFKGAIPLVKTMDELHTQLGAFPFTIVTPEDRISDAIELQRNSTKEYGYMNIVATTKDIIDELSLFRREDMMIVPVNGSLESVIESIYNQFVISDFIRQNRTLGCYIAPELTNEIRDKLIELATAYPSMKFGYVSPSMVKYVYRSCRIPMGETAFIAIDGENRSYYKKDGYAVDDSIWDYLNRIESGELKRTYLSEDPYNDTTHLVGSNYVEFMRRDDSDKVVYYYDEPDEGIIEVFHNLSSMNYPNISFGFINRAANSAEIKFPSSPLNSFIKFVHGDNISESLEFLHKVSTDTILSFARKVSRKEHHFNFTPMVQDVFKDDVLTYIKLMPYFLDDERESLRKYFKDMWVELGIEIQNITTEEPDITDLEL